MKPLLGVAFALPLGLAAGATIGTTIAALHHAAYLYRVHRDRT